ncbi:MAG: DNA alkylation repair protein [Deltaproteobacteria bacterium]|nr:DNA alkylation repair protein [Candidatus Zymogenaceae bacterium]
MNATIKNIRTDLSNSADETARVNSQRFFKEEVLCYGVKGAVVRSIARKYYKEVAALDKGEIFALCEELFRSDLCEEAFVVGEWLPRIADRFEPGDLAIFEGWIERYINNWAKCDSFCNHTVGDFAQMYPECLPRIIQWTGSGNRWMRRAAAVSLIIPARRGKFLPEILEMADRLLTDSDDMVRKGYGWMLKEASRLHQQEVFAYVVKHRKVMPRTALRYAIELMPKDLKAEAMKKG